MEFKEYKTYRVYEDGTVVDKYGRCKSLIKRKDGYVQVMIAHQGTRELILLHRLVAKLFIPNPYNLPIVHHIDGNKHNNHITNLSWVDRATNANEYAKDFGRCIGVEVTDTDGYREEYMSIAKAAKTRHMSRGTVRRRIKEGVDSDGATWRALY